MPSVPSVPSFLRWPRRSSSTSTFEAPTAAGGTSSTLLGDCLHRDSSSSSTSTSSTISSSSSSDSSIDSKFESMGSSTDKSPATSPKTTPVPKPLTLTLGDVCPGTRLTLPWWEEALLYPCFILLCAPIFTFTSFGLLFVPRFGWAGAATGYLSALSFYWVLLYFDLVPRRERLSPAGLSCWLLRAIVRYFNYYVIVEDPSSIQPSTPYIGAQSPHGIYPIASVCGAPFNPFIFPGRDAYCMAASALQLQPFLWQWLETLGGRPISAAGIRKVVEQGDVCCLVPGGIAEMFMLDTTNKTEQVLIRRGFVREALKNQVDILPIYHFNHTQTFSYILPPRLNACLAVACRKSGLPGCFLIGRWGLFVPYKVKMFTVVGKPIQVRRSSSSSRIPGTEGGKEGGREGKYEPTGEEIETVVTEYKEALRRIYYTYRPADGQRELVMVDNHKGRSSSSSNVSRGSSVSD